MFHRLMVRRLSSMIHGTRDRFGGMNVHSINAGLTKGDNFEDILQKSMSEWRLSGIRGIWFHVSDDDTIWIKTLLQNGFEFHHAKNRTAVLTKWLSNESNEIADYPSLYIGVGTITINDQDEILVIKEKVQLATAVNFKKWKFPGGYVDRNENIFDGAVREVFEETGVETEPLGIIGFRHIQPQPPLTFPSFHCSDIFGKDKLNIYSILPQVKVGIW